MTSRSRRWPIGDPAPAVDDPLWSRAPLRHRAELAVLGHPLVVRSNAPDLVALAREAFGRFAAPAAGRATLTLDLVAGGAADAPTGMPPSHREHGALFVAADGCGSLVAVDLAAGAGHAFVGEGARPEAVRAVILEAAAYRFVTWHGSAAMHAAAVVVGGQTLVLRGGGGAGKSTLAYAAARAGHAVMADEVTWWDAAAGFLRGTPWWLRLEPEARALFPELRTLEPVPRAQGGPKLVADAAALALRTVEAAPPGPLLILEPAEPRGTASSWRWLPPEDARDAFRAAMIPGEHAQPAAGLAAAVDALLARGAYGLVAGSPASAVAALEAIARAAAGDATA